MSRVVRDSRVAGMLAVLFLLTACGGMQSKPAATSRGLVASPTVSGPDSPASPTTPPAPTHDQGNAPVADATGDHAPPTEQKSAVMPPCTCATAEPKHRPKRKPRRRKQAPAPTPPPPVAATPTAGVVNAEVRSMNVPVMSILGKRVQSPTGEDMGRVVDVLADDSGHVRVAIIDFGGFLGVGNRRIAVDWPLLRFDPSGHDPSLQLTLSMQELRAAPEYKENARPQILAEPPVPAAPAAVPENKK